MYLQDIDGILPAQKVKIKYDCNGGYERCGKEWMLKLENAQKNFANNDGKHICRSCQISKKNPMRDKKVQEKIKETTMKRYGVSCALNTQENIEKRKKLFENEERKTEWNRKRRETCRKKYGADHAAQSDQVKKKQRQTMMENYGVEFPYQSEEIMAKMKKHNMEKYGVENVAQLPEVQIKMAKTTLEKYGVERYNELPEMREYLRENCREWLAESWANPWAKGITRPEEWNQKQRETVAELVARGEWHTGDKNSIKGRYSSKKCTKKDPLFRSSYELIVHIWLDENRDVLGYEYEPYMIAYYDTEGKHRYYFPDFLVKFKRSRLFLLEVKNDYALKFAINISKDKAAKEYASQNDLDYELWSNQKIKELGIDHSNFQERYILF